MPEEAAVRETGFARAHRLADREVDVVLGDVELALGHPELEQAGVEVDERRPSKHLERPRRRVVREIEHQVGIGRRLLHAPPALDEPWVELVAAEARQRERVVQAVRLEPGAQRGDLALDERPRVRRCMLADVLEPDHTAAERSQRQGPVEIDPEMTGALGIAERERGHANGRHEWNGLRQRAGGGSPA
jgi:hypothetical protein